MAADSHQIDFYISANSESATAKEVAQVLEQAGYSIYLPERNDETAAKRLAANKSQAFVLLLTDDSDQHRFLADILNFAPLGMEGRRVIVIQFEDCELACLIDPGLITNLASLTDARARRLGIIDAVEESSPKAPLAEVDRAMAVHLSDGDMPQPETGTCPPASTAVPGSHQQDFASQKTATSNADARKKRSALSAILAVIDRPKPDSIYETDNSAIDDPLVALVDIMSEKEHRSSPSSRPPKWLSKELAAARHGSASLSGEDRRDNRDARPATGNILEVAVSHPPQFSMGAPFIIDALVYRQVDRRLAVLRAAELSADDRRFYSDGPIEAVGGSKLRITIKLPWLTKPIAQTIPWNWELTNTSFRIVPPKYAASKTVNGKCEISVDGLPIGQVHFQLRLENASKLNERRISSAPAIKSVFASYVRQDRRRVLARVQSLERLGVSVLLDHEELRGNPKFKKEIFDVIDSADALYLFWSQHLGWRRQSAGNV
jgi:hypothetical protein